MLRVVLVLHVAVALVGAWFLGAWVPLAVGASLALFITLATTHPGWELFGPADSRGPREDLVALTFDDGPHPESTPQLLEALREAGMKATFFVLVDRCERWPELLEAIAEEHEVALHGLRHHPWIALWSPRRGAAELREARARLAELSGQEIALYRPPFGITSPRMAEATEAVGLRTIWCSVRPLDGTIETPDRVLSACRSARGGDIVLLHEGPGRPAAKALGEALRELQGRGLRSVTVGELLA